MRKDFRTPKALEETNINHRATLISDEEAQIFAKRYVLWRLFVIPLAVFAFTIILPIGTMYPRAYLFLAALFLTVIRIYFGSPFLRTILTTIIAPIIALSVGEILIWFIRAHSANYQWVLATTGAIAALFLSEVYFGSSGLLSFAWNWCLADPAIRGEVASAFKRRGPLFGLAELQNTNATAFKRSVATGLATLLVLTFVAGTAVVFVKVLFAPGTTNRIWLSGNLDHKVLWGIGNPIDDSALMKLLFIALLMVTCLLWFLRRGGHAATLLGHYLSYDRTTSEAPGIFRTRSALRARKASLGVIAISVSLCSLVGDYFLVPPMNYHGKAAPFFSGHDSLRVADLVRTPLLPFDIDRFQRWIGKTAPRFSQEEDSILEDHFKRSNMHPQSNPWEPPDAINRMLGPDMMGPDGKFTMPNLSSDLDRVNDQIRRGVAQTRSDTLASPSAKTRDSLLKGFSPSDRFYREPTADAYSEAADLFVSATVTRIESLTWLLCLSLLTITPILCALLLPALAYFEVVSTSTARVAALNPLLLWEQLVERVRESTVEIPATPTSEPIRERDHLYVGFDLVNNYPVMLHKDLINEHVYINGDSGSGKTSQGMLPLTRQLIQNNSCLIIDLKGDHALLHAIRSEAERLKRPFRLFTPELNKDSHYFNPFFDFDLKSRTASSFAALLLDALNLNHGDGYGRSHFTAKSMALLRAVIEGHNPATIRELYALMAAYTARTPHKERLDAFELVSAVHMLSEYPKLNPDNSVAHEDIIHMPRLLDQNEVVYFWLPAATESITVREIGKLALFSLFSTLQARQDKEKAHLTKAERDSLPRPKTTYVIIDEFQRLAGQNFKILLEQGRSFGLGLVLANQTISDLNTPSVDLRNTVRTNTRVKLYFSLSELEEIKNLSALSGTEFVEAITRSTSTGRAHFALSHTESLVKSETISPRLTPQDIQRINDHPNQLVLHVSRGLGLSQFGGLPIPVQAMWSTSKEQHDKYSRDPWPVLTLTPPNAIVVSTEKILQVEARVLRDTLRYGILVAEHLEQDPQLRLQFVQSKAPRVTSPRSSKSLESASVADPMSELFELATEGQLLSSPIQEALGIHHPLLGLDSGSSGLDTYGADPVSDNLFDQ